MKTIERLLLLPLAFGGVHCDAPQRHAGLPPSSSTTAAETPGHEDAEEGALPPTEREREAPPGLSNLEDEAPPNPARGAAHAEPPRKVPPAEENTESESADEPPAQRDPIAGLIESAKATPERCGALLARAQVRIANSAPDCDSDDDCELVHQVCEPLLCTIAGHVDVAEDMKRLHAATGPAECHCDLSGQRCAASVAKCLKGRCALAAP